MAEDLFILSLSVFPVVLAVGYILESIVRGKDLGPFTSIISILMFIGVFFHEISHYLFCLITRVPTKGLYIRFRYKGYINPHGEVIPEYPYQITFLKAMLISLGPLLIGTWVAYFSLNIALSSMFDPLVRIIAGLIVISILLASTPSPDDFRMISFGFSNDQKHSWYQLILLSLSILLAWGVITQYNWVFPIEFLYYFVTVGFYFILKFSIVGIRWGFNKLRTRFGNEQNRKKFRQFSRRRYKSLKFK